MNLQDKTIKISPGCFFWRVCQTKCWKITALLNILFQYRVYTVWSKYRNSYNDSSQILMFDSEKKELQSSFPTHITWTPKISFHTSLWLHQSQAWWAVYLMHFKALATLLHLTIYQIADDSPAITNRRCYLFRLESLFFISEMHYLKDRNLLHWVTSVVGREGLPFRFYMQR